MSVSIGVEDTSAEAAAQMIERWREMSPADKLGEVAALNNACEQLSEAGIRIRYPGADDAEVHRRALALRLGRDTMVRVYGWDPAIEGW
jgi:hypothetical protein